MTILRIVISALTLIFIHPTPGHSVEILAGIGAVDQGDDVTRPGALMEVKISPSTFAGGFVYGRSFAGVKETAYVIHYGWKEMLFGSLPIYARAGVTLLDEATEINNEFISKEEHNYNIGGFLGAGYSQRFGRVVVEGIWDSHLYPAGLNGFLLMATGRKQMIGLLVGISL